jgi:hypothetical protein
MGLFDVEVITPDGIELQSMYDCVKVLVYKNGEAIVECADGLKGRLTDYSFDLLEYERNEIIERVDSLVPPGKGWFQRFCKNL